VGGVPRPPPLILPKKAQVTEQGSIVALSHMALLLEKTSIAGRPHATCNVWLGQRGKAVVYPSEVYARSLGCEFDEAGEMGGYRFFFTHCRLPSPYGITTFPQHSRIKHRDTNLRFVKKASFEHIHKISPLIYTFFLNTGKKALIRTRNLA